MFPFHRLDKIKVSVKEIKCLPKVMWQNQDLNPVFSNSKVNILNPYSRVHCLRQHAYRKCHKKTNNRGGEIMEYLQYTQHYRRCFHKLFYFIPITLRTPIFTIIIYLFFLWFQCISLLCQCRNHKTNESTLGL